jgi:hypothetical protein
MAENKTEPLELVMFADQQARQLIHESSRSGWTLDEALQVSAMTWELMCRLQTDRQQVVEAMLIAKATLKLVSGDLVAN